MSSRNQSCDWCVGVALALFVGCIVVIVASGLVITSQVLPHQCASYSTTGDCR